MLFSEEDAPELKKWIVKRLENTSDADADVLADYVLALLRHEGDTETVRRLCEDEIPDFLQEDSSVFVRDVFNAITFKTYLSGNSVPLQASFAPPAGPANTFPPSGPSGSRKRSLDHNDNHSFQYGGNDRAFKQPRRGGNMNNMGRGGFDGRGGRGGLMGGMNGQMPGMPPPPLGMPAFDPNNPMASMLAMQAMGFPMPDIPGMPPQNQNGRGRPRCRDYDTKGFCARGNACRFEHGAGSIYVPPGASDEYDPKNAVLPGLGNQQQQPQSQPQAQPQFNKFRGSERGRGRGRGDRGGSLNNRGGRRAEFSSDRPNFDRSKTAIVVEQIPEEKFSEEAVKEFFSEFGNIIEVNMQPYKRLAVVKYDDWNAAQAAYKSPKVIFDNRFVKVYWFSDPSALPQPPAGQSQNGAEKQESGTPVPAREPEEPLDLEEFRRKQEEAQRSHELKMKKKAETEAAQAELEKRREELLRNQEAEKKKLMEKLAARGEGHSVPSAIEAPKSSSQTEALKAQLAALEAEAKSLGIDPSKDEYDPSFRGRGRGRGYRGRGAFVPRGRGAYRGRGGAPFANAAAYNLDNRPKKIALTGADFTVPERDESLRQYLLGIGEFTALDVSPSKTSITFLDRRTAEKFMYGTPGCDIPGVGKVEMAWAKTPLPPVDLEKLKAKQADDMDYEAGTADDAYSGYGGNGNGVGAAGQEQEMDYDVADDNDWAQ